MPSLLVVDDDEIIRGMLAFLFEGEGYAVDQARDGAEALELLAGSSYDCMVLDLMMPGVDGLGVLRARAERSLAPELRIVVLTAKAGGQDEVWCWEAGADEYVTKPFEPDLLLRVVRELSGIDADEARRRREVGLAEARRLDALEATLRERR